MTEPWYNFSTEYTDSHLGFLWYVDCLGATSTNEPQRTTAPCSLRLEIP